MDIKSEDKHTLFLKTAYFFRNVKSFVEQQEKIESVWK